MLGAVCLTFAGFATVKVYNIVKKKRNGMYTEASKFFVDSEFNSVLNEFEVLHGADGKRQRVKTREDAKWNVMNGGSFKAIHKGDARELFPAVAKNVLNVRVVTAKADITTHVLGVCSSYALVNTHALAGCRSGNILVAASGTHIGENDYFTSVFDESSIVDMGSDVCLIDLKKRTFKDITMHFIDGDVPSYMNGVFMANDVRVTYHNVKMDVIDKFTKVVLQDFISYTAPHKVSICGNPIVCKVDSLSCGIVGIHAAGAKASEMCFGAVTKRGSVLLAVEKMKKSSLFVPMFSEGDFRVNVEDLGIKSPFRHEHLPFIKLFGKVEGNIKMNKKSMMHKSPLAAGLDGFFFDNFGYKCEERFGIPMMKPSYVNGEYVSPYNKGLLKMNNDPPSLNPIILKRVIDEMTSHIVSELSKVGITRLSPLTMEEAINGIECDDFTSRINATTSGGFGFPGCKGDYIPIVSELDNKVVREPVDSLKRLLNDCISNYKREQNNNFVYSAQLKDEPRSLVKCKNGGTRLFYMSSLENLILCRMYLSPFYTLMVEKGYIFYSAVGINMHTQSDKFVRDLSDFSDCIMEGDYEGFDIRNPVDISRAAATIVYMVLQRLGYNSDSLCIVQGLLSDVISPIVEMCMDLFVKVGMQPSGKYATAEDNCLRGVLMMMYAYYTVEPLWNTRFHENVKMQVYGDDVLAAVRPMFAHLFNNNVYQTKCKTLYNMNYTSASKDVVLKNFMSVTEMSFLKRKFVYKCDKGLWEGQLSLSSIYKSLEWVIPSKAITEEMQVIATVSLPFGSCIFIVMGKCLLIKFDTISFVC
jgi:hypothetical protein